MNINSLPWKVRAIQLDLARHMETVPFICSYADFAAEHGFNTLALYLEGRVRTRSFPFRARTETYSLEEMGKVVRHVKSNGMDIIPVVSTLGHGEQFLACKQLSHLAETRDGRARFAPPSGPGHVICPSLDETYEFFEGYFAEIFQVFTGKNVHVGLDEAFDLGYCNLCGERWGKEGLGAIFTKHVQRVEKMLGKMGKRMWMWDDMYEMFPDELVKAPRHIVMCHWNYDDLIEPEGGKAHLVSRWRQDWLKVYEKYGLDAVVCPLDRNPKNIETITNYGRRHQVLGGLLTQWECSPRLFPPGQKAIVAFTGQLWSQKEYSCTAAWEAGIRTMAPQASAVLIDAIRELLRINRIYPPPLIQNYLYGLMVREEVLHHAVVKMALGVIRMERERDGRLKDNDFLDYLEWGAGMELLYWELRDLLPAILHPRRMKADIISLRRRAEAWKRQNAELWKLWDRWADRLHLNEHPMDKRSVEYWKQINKALEPVWNRLDQKPASKDWLVVLRLFLQDFYSAPRLKVVVTCGQREQVIADGNFKPSALLSGRVGGHYDLYIPFSSPAVPDGIRLEGGGYGGQGIAFVELQNPAITLMPCCIRSIKGMVNHAEAVLRDDSAFACLGFSDTLAQMHYPQLAVQSAVLDLGLKKNNGAGKHGVKQT